MEEIIIVRCQILIRHRTQDFFRRRLQDLLRQANIVSVLQGTVFFVPLRYNLNQREERPGRK